MPVDEAARKAAIAFCERETPLMTSLRAGFVQHVEAWFRTLKVTPETIEAVGKLLGDMSALYCLQAGMSREDFLAYMTQGFDCYGFFVDNSKNEAGEIDLQVTHALGDTLRPPKTGPHS